MSSRRLTTQARGAKPIAEIVGFGMSSDAHHITQPSAEGTAKAIRIALKDARISPGRIGYVDATRQVLR